MALTDCSHSKKRRYTTDMQSSDNSQTADDGDQKSTSIMCGLDRGTCACGESAPKDPRRPEDEVDHATRRDTAKLGTSDDNNNDSTGERLRNLRDVGTQVATSELPVERTRLRVGTGMARSSVHTTEPRGIMVEDRIMLITTVRRPNSSSLPKVYLKQTALGGWVADMRSSEKIKEEIEKGRVVVADVYWTTRSYWYDGKCDAWDGDLSWSSYDAGYDMPVFCEDGDYDMSCTPHVPEPGPYIDLR
ncbi:hypothetical protein BJ508DRAFT_314251 [Ascobolus immersus RN42]|uniref:Uncharacterized protein n=1 Tax=Ascobolus immersus RN42 TaxID=1160509 RepID=A0A3N4HJ73_ASCIM|nr:hypothetical protein BJ508DRAFT_314251 [Ascobolus immersus RN42]